MKKIFFVLAAVPFLLASCRPTVVPSEDVLDYVNPFIGNDDNGHTFPGAAAPFGYVQASPESGLDDWKYCSGYNLRDDSLIGFAQTHLNGTGCPDLGDVLLFPFTGERKIYKSPYDKQTQKAHPGWYTVKLTDTDINVEATATERTAFYRFTYGGEDQAKLLVDLQSGVVFNQEWLHTHVLSSTVNMPDRWTLTGEQETQNWVRRKFFYCIKFDHPYTLVSTLEKQGGEKGDRLILGFDLNPSEPLQVKVAFSTVGIEGAERALLAEAQEWEFEAVRMKTEDKWRNLLSRMEITGTDDQKVSAYTSLYHLFLQPNNIADADGNYRGADDEVHTSSCGSFYSTFSLWDTYRAAHPFYTILIPSKVPAFIESMVAHYSLQGYLPMWVLADKDTHCMIGNHSVPVVVEAWRKGLLTDMSSEVLYDAVRTSLTFSHKKSDFESYDKYGYYPFDIVTVESVSRTLECGYDDYCAAIMADSLGKTEDRDFFMKRSNYWKNLFDASTRLMRAKDSNGSWESPFNPYILSHAASCGGHYTEGNAWQYSWHVQQDVPGLVEIMGGKEKFVEKLDSLFSLDISVEQNGFVSDVSGLIGQYAQGNEPSHHVAYMYQYADRPDRTAELVREICDQFYRPYPDGLCGNDDCGQMSAWYLFSAMGFYPMNPVSGEYVLGAPQIERVTLHLENGKTFSVHAIGLSEENKYVESVTLNGKPLDGFILKHEDVMRGGELEFVMTNKK